MSSRKFNSKSLEKRQLCETKLNEENYESEELLQEATCLKLNEKLESNQLP